MIWLPATMNIKTPLIAMHRWKFHIKSDDTTIFIETLPIKRATLPGAGGVNIISFWELMERAGFGKKCEGQKNLNPFTRGAPGKKGSGQNHKPCFRI